MRHWGGGIPNSGIMHPRLQLTHGVGVVTGDFEVVDLGGTKINL